MNLQNAEKQHVVDIEVSAALEKSLITHQFERNERRQDQEQCRRDLSKDIQALKEALKHTEERYRALEARSLLELDRERQRLMKAEKETASVRKQQQSEQQRHQKEIAKLHTAAIRSGELIGKQRGRLQTLGASYKLLLKENKCSSKHNELRSGIACTSIFHKPYLHCLAKTIYII